MNNQTKRIWICGFTAVVLTVGNLLAGEGSIPVKGELSEASYRKLARISEKEAQHIVQKQKQGSILKTELESEGGFLVYEVKIQDASGVVHEFTVDAGNGKILKQEVESQDVEKLHQKKVNRTFTKQHPVS